VKRDRRLPLQLKLTAALVLIVMTPLVASAYLMDQLGKVATNVAADEAASRIDAMNNTLKDYDRLFDSIRRLHHEIALRIADRPEIRALDPTVNLTKMLLEEAPLRQIVIRRPDGTTVAEAEAPAPGPGWSDVVADPYAIGDSGATLQLTFSVPDAIVKNQQALLRARMDAESFKHISTALPDSYRMAVLVLLGVAGFAAMAVGIWASSFVTRRLTALVDTARKVSEGHLDARVTLRGSDELAELGGAFNTMLDDLDQTRAQLEYLQRMGVWQDVARRLAHEIKNPLTPIQLAVQQCVSSYKGDDPRYTKLLVDTGEIVAEEIESLRRLVDTFRTLGALPKVEKAPIVLADVLEELKLDPAVAALITLAPPDEPVTVRADKLLLKRVLANLIENGIQAGQEAGNAGGVVIGWSADPAADAVTITVDDHGRGVSDTDRETIFEPYVTTKVTGTGLGLAIARKIAIEHGGDLVLAADRAPIGGARFLVSLPLRGPDASLADG
jgi:nitrogen fixation/metabolism regulation signal transduction histidine kinase